MKTKKILEIASAFLHNPALFAEELVALSFADRAAIWKALDVVYKGIEPRKEEIRKFLLDDAKAHGEPTDKGGQVLRDAEAGFTITREKREGKLPEEKPLRELLKAKKIGIADAFDEVKTLVPSTSKLDYLIQTGKLTQAEVDTLKKVSYALKVDAPEEFGLLLEEITGSKSKD